MKWLTANLLTLLILTAICLIVLLGSFVRIRFVTPNWIVFWTIFLVDAALLVAVVI